MTETKCGASVSAFDSVINPRLAGEDDRRVTLRINAADWAVWQTYKDDPRGVLVTDRNTGIRFRLRRSDGKREDYIARPLVGELIYLEA